MNLHKKLLAVAKLLSYTLARKQLETNLKRHTIWKSVLKLRWKVPVHQILHAPLQRPKKEDVNHQRIQVKVLNYFNFSK